MTAGAAQTGTLWAWPDALFAAVTAICLATLCLLLAARLGRSSAAGPAVAAALVLALSGAVLTHGLPVERWVLATVLAVLTATIVLARRRRAVRSARTDVADRNAIAPSIGR